MDKKKFALVLIASLILLAAIILVWIILAPACCRTIHDCKDVPGNCRIDCLEGEASMVQYSGKLGGCNNEELCCVQLAFPN